MNLHIACNLILLAITLWTPAHTIAEEHGGEYNGDLDDKTKKQVRECELNLELMELCMRCAKITKSTYVYPMCCGNEEKVMDWCHDYVYFGISNRPPKP